MSGTRVHELAKELSLSSKDIVSVLQKKGFEVKSHMSVLTKEMVSVVKKEMVPVPEKKASVKKAATPEKKKAPSTKVEEKKK